MTVITRGIRFSGLVFFSLLLSVFCFAPVQAVTVQPGQPSQIKIKAPPAAQAGVNFSVQLTVVDPEGNIVKNYDELKRKIILSTTGSGKLSKRVLSSGQFKQGRLTLSVAYNSAEEIRIQAKEEEHVASGWSESIMIRPGPPDRFVLDTPDTVRAGADFSLAIKVLDAHGNRVYRYKNMTNGLMLKSTGMAKPVPEFLPVRQIRQGKLQVSVSYRVAEEIKLIVEDEVNEIKSISETIQVVPAALSELTVSVPRKVNAAEPFRAAIEARDKYGNIIDNYSEIGGGIDVESTASGQVKPSYIPPEEFVDGVTFTRFTYDKAESFRLQVEDRASPVGGQSTMLRCQAGKVANFGIEVPVEVTAGDKFSFQVTARDTYGNRVRRFSKTGDTLAIFVRNEPEKQINLSPSEFKQGRATAKFSYTSARNIKLVVQSSRREIRRTSDLIRVTPAEPGEVRVDVPGQVKAGVKFPVTFTLTDKFGNKIKDPSNLAGKIQTGLKDGQAVQVKKISPGEFVNGRKQLSFWREEADTVLIFAEYSKFNIRNKSKPIEIIPAGFDHVAVRTPGQVTAGESFEVAIQLQDLYGNPLREVPTELSALRILSTGSGEVQPKKVTSEIIEAPAFTVQLKYFIAEGLALRVVNSRGKELGVSAPISIQPGKLANFSLATPGEVSADHSFPLRIEAEDKFGNLIQDLNTRQGEVKVSASPAGNNQWEGKKLHFRDFVNGTTETTLEYHQAGPLQLVARSQGIKSSSDTILVQAGAPQHFRVQAPARVEAGQPFSSRITVYDQFGNRVKELPTDFNGVRLRTEGFERVSPTKISTSLFKDGRANIYLIYPRSGKISLSAEPFPRALEAPVVERVFISRNPDSAHLYAVFTGKPQVKIKEKPRNRRFDVVFHPAILPTDSSYRSYHNWFIKKIAQRQVGTFPLPKVVLRIFPRQRVGVEKTLENNLLTLQLNRVHTKLPTLNDIQKLISDREFDQARKKLKLFLEENPDNSYANRLRHRLERIEDVINQ